MYRLLTCLNIPYQRVVVLKDQTNKKAHESSAQLACEAAASIRTVAALTRENDCCELYSQSLEGPLRKSNRTAVWSNAFYSFSQGMSFFVIALVFWYGSILVSSREFGTLQFFVGLMVRCGFRARVSHKSQIPPFRPQPSQPFRLETSLPSCLISLPPKGPAPISSSCSIRCPKSIQNRKMAKLLMSRKVKAISASKTCTSVTRPDLVCVC